MQKINADGALLTVGDETIAVWFVPQLTRLAAQQNLFALAARRQRHVQ